MVCIALSHVSANGTGRRRRQDILTEIGLGRDTKGVVVVFFPIHIRGHGAQMTQSEGRGSRTMKHGEVVHRLGLPAGNFPLLDSHLYEHRDDAFGHGKRIGFGVWTHLAVVIFVAKGIVDKDQKGPRLDVVEHRLQGITWAIAQIQGHGPRLRVWRQYGSLGKGFAVKNIARGMPLQIGGIHALEQITVPGGLDQQKDQGHGHQGLDDAFHVEKVGNCASSFALSPGKSRDARPPKMFPLG